MNLTQEKFGEVALAVIRKIEQGKANLILDKINLTQNVCTYISIC